jgi:purine-nucleoside phosphorylase
MSDQIYQPLEAAKSAAKEIAEITGKASHDMSFTLGSGWSDAATIFGEPTHKIEMSKLSGFAESTVVGHGGHICSYTIDKKNILIFFGRTHLYEGKGIDAVVHGARTAVSAGVKIVVLTNACGGINPNYSVGQPVLIRDHISLTGISPIKGANFVDLTDVYSARLRAQLKTYDPTLAEGVYAHWPGPTYETPAEIKMIGILGADLVGMSTVPEAIAAHAMGAEVIGISLVTNPAAGLSKNKLSHEEVIAAGKASAERVGKLLENLLKVS